MNKSHQSDQYEYLSVSEGEEYDHQEDDVDDEEGIKAKVDCKARVTFHVMNDGSSIVTMVILEHNYELDPALSRFLPYHRELNKTLKRSFVAHDIAGLRHSKSIRLLEEKFGGPECTIAMEPTMSTSETLGNDATSAILAKLEAMARQWEVINEILDHIGVLREQVDCLGPL
ncbi:hypothetical protein CQW23_23417 [Capsicum baccatum]|uniref:Uncharacterized protein n=1 Tax=Capsicum baccatum TaxID=33114 RepID=A0A2G2VRV3_CAPBA|nr:hypothetical protein CQW23_23417 [Capsicum baccatum]